MIERARCGFAYTIEAFDRFGNPVGEVETSFNKMPIEFLNYMLSAAHKKGTQHNNWYAGLYIGDYTPVGNESMSTLPSVAQEFTGYSGASRPSVLFGSPVNGRIDNAANMIELTFNQDVAVRGGFLTNSQGKGATSGICASVVKFTSPRQPGIGGILRISVGQELIS